MDYELHNKKIFSHLSIFSFPVQSFPMVCHFLLHFVALKNSIKRCLPVHNHWWHPHVTLRHDFIDPLKSYHFRFHYGISNCIKVYKRKTGKVNYIAEHYKLLTGTDFFRSSSCINHQYNNIIALLFHITCPLHFEIHVNM